MLQRCWRLVRAFTAMDSPEGEVEATYPPPPAGWSPLTLTRTLLDIAYWAGRANPQQPRGGWGLGAPSATRGGKQKGGAQPELAPSTAVALQELVSSVTFSAELPIASAAEPPCADPLMASIIERTVNNIATVRTAPPADIPVSTAFHDSSQLRWDAADEHLCSSGADCVAWHLAGAPGPLPVYAAPGMDRAEVLMPAFCLLCIRADAAAVCRIAGAISKATPYVFGMTPCVLPPFQNLVDCQDGYYSEALGVTPSQDILSPISIASAAFPLEVLYDAVGEVFFVDQSAGVWRPDRKFSLN